MQIPIDLETVPSPDRDYYLKEARENFKAPSSLTKAQAGKDLGLEGNDLKFKPAPEVIAQWEKEMASTKSEEVGDQNWRKTALDATYGRVLAIGWKVGVNAHVRLNDPHAPAAEAETLMAFFDEVESARSDRQPGAAGRNPYFIGHNVTFDLKFLFRRAVILGIKPPFQLPFKGRHGSDYFCTMQAWCDYRETISLDNLCKCLGIEGKNGMDGSMVCDAWLNGEMDKIREYCADDVELANKVYRRLQWLDF